MDTQCCPHGAIIRLTCGLVNKKKEARQLTSLFLTVDVLSLLRPHLYAAGFDWYLREIVSTNKLAGTWLDHVVEEHLADRVVAGAWFTVVKNSKEGSVKFIVENRITCLPDRGAEAGSVSYNLKAGDVELGIVLRVK